jgi:hypothetical protein
MLSEKGSPYHYSRKSGNPGFSIVCWTPASAGGTNARISSQVLTPAAIATIEENWDFHLPVLELQGAWSLGAGAGLFR